MNTIPSLPSASTLAGFNKDEGIRLPFPALFSWVINGKPAFKQQGGAQYFGGFAAKAEETEEYLQAINRKTLPAQWVDTEFNTDSGDTFFGFSARSIGLAAIAKRTRWMTDDHASPHYFDGARQHVQVLAYMCEKADNILAPFGPVVITAKGKQSAKVLEALSNWDKATKKLRDQVAPGWPSNAFWCFIGTWGKEREAIMVGKGAQSPITPITLYIPKPEDFTPERFARLWVGEEIANEMARLKTEAAEWLGAWEGKPNNNSKDQAAPEDDGPENFPF